MQREGVKTHKEKVEELNKYLSNLSEHHDMYVQLTHFISSIPCEGHRLLRIYLLQAENRTWIRNRMDIERLIGG